MVAPRAVAVLLATFFASTALAGCFDRIFDDPGAAGDWAREFLSDKKYTSLLVEVDHQAGGAPEPSTMTALRSVLESTVTKPGGIEIRTSADLSGSGGRYSFSQIRDMEDDARDHEKGGKRAVFYVMFVNGGSSEDSGDSRVLGAAYSGSSVVMFKDNIRKAKDSCLSVAALGCPTVAAIEEAVMIHELGHILGLVNNGIPMVEPHEDPEHEAHSTNERSVMYWKVETGDIIDFILSGNKIPNRFDEMDRADMRAAGGK